MNENVSCLLARLSELQMYKCIDAYLAALAAFENEQCQDGFFAVAHTVHTCTRIEAILYTHTVHVVI